MIWRSAARRLIVTIAMCIAAWPAGALAWSAPATPSYAYDGASATELLSAALAAGDCSEQGVPGRQEQAGALVEKYDERAHAARASARPDGLGVAPNTAGARFVAGSDGVVTDLVGRAPNEVSIGHYPGYVNLGARTGARTFSMSDEAWNVMSPTEQWVRNQRFLDRAIRQGSEIRLATPVDLAKPGSFFERELQYLFKHGYAPNADGTMLVRGGL